MFVACDGMGGAGAKVYRTPLGNVTGAYVAANLGIFVTEQVAKRLSDCVEAAIASRHDMVSSADRFAHRIPSFLEKRLRAAFGLSAASLADWNTPSRLRGTMQRSLPTTIAGAAIMKRTSSDQLLVSSFWAGDSRVYVLLPDGLRQISKDDLTVDQDPYENLKGDAPISNMINGTGAFKLRSRVNEIPVPCAIFAATDGAFGYLPTPAHFERILLTSLIKADSKAEWSTLLSQGLFPISGDDVSIVGRLYGDGDFERGCPKISAASSPLPGIFSQQTLKRLSSRGRSDQREDDR